jgi:hypothetical protein
VALEGGLPDVQEKILAAAREYLQRNPRGGASEP